MEEKKQALEDYRLDSHPSSVISDTKNHFFSKNLTFPSRN